MIAPGQRQGRREQDLIALYQQVITVGDMNAEPPDVVDARKKPNSTRKVAEDILRKGVNEFPLEVLSGRVVTHHQNTRGQNNNKQQQQHTNSHTHR